MNRHFTEVTLFIYLKCLFNNGHLNGTLSHLLVMCGFKDSHK